VTLGKIILSGVAIYILFALVDGMITTVLATPNASAPSNINVAHSNPATTDNTVTTGDLSPHGRNILEMNITASG